MKNAESNINQMEKPLQPDKENVVLPEDESLVAEETIEENEEEMATSPSADAPEEQLPPFWADPEDTGVFKAVDRNSEDLAVVGYQKMREDRNLKYEKLLDLRRPTLRKWGRAFRELGRTQKAIMLRLIKVWERCLTVRETNGAINFANLLHQSMLTDLHILATQSGKERIWDRLKSKAPAVKPLEAEDMLFRDYLAVIQQMNDLLGELYAIREPTMKIWAKRYHYLSTSEEEMLAELRLIWVRCINEYEYEAKERAISTRRGHHVHDKNGVKKRLKKTSFNTYKFSSFRNFIINQLKKKYRCKKRIDENGVPYETTMMSLDHQYDEKDGDGISLHDVVASPIHYEGRSLAADMQIEQIAGNDPEIRYALEKLAYDPQVKTLESACRLRTGTIDVSKADRDIIYAAQVTKDESWKEHLASLIASAGLYPEGFNLVSAQIWPKNIAFEVKVRDAQLLLRTKKAIKASKLEKEFRSI